MKKNILSGLLILGMALASSNALVAYHDDRGDRALTGGLLGGIGGAAIGGAAWGGTGAAVGGVTGFGLGALIGGSTTPRHHRDPQSKLDRLYSKRDTLNRRLGQAKSERSRARIQRSLDRVNADIRSYEPHYDMKPRYGVRTR